MSVFDQRDQKVGTQYNAAGNINVGNVQNKTDVISELEKLKTEVTNARDAEVINAEIATDVDYHITKAVQQASKLEPNKNTILEHITKAKDLIKGVAETGGIVTALMKIAELIQKFF